MVKPRTPPYGVRYKGIKYKVEIGETQMPSIVKSKEWFIRVDYPHEHVTPKVKTIEGWVDCQAILAATHVGETAEHPHFHAVIRLTSELQKQSFDARLKTLFSWKKGSDYSSKPWDGKDGACSYLFHESSACVIANKGFTEDDIARYKDLNQKVQEVVAVNKERGTKKSVQRIIDKMAQDCGHSDIANVMMNEIRAGEMYHPGDYRFGQVVEEIYIKTRSNAAFKEYKDVYIRTLSSKHQWTD